MALRSISLTNVDGNAYPFQESIKEETKPIKIAKKTLKPDRALSLGSPSPKRAVSDLAARITSSFSKQIKKKTSEPPCVLTDFEILVFEAADPKLVKNREANSGRKVFTRPFKKKVFP